MKRKMDDQMVEGGFLDEFHKFVDDLVTFPLRGVQGARSSSGARH